jgi:hypothetical protein
MKSFMVWVVAGLSVVGCAEDRVCDPDPPGWYAIDFHRAVIACSDDVFDTVRARGLLVSDDNGSLESRKFSSDGCELHVKDYACYGGDGFCGELRWTEPGVYEGELTYAQAPFTSEWKDCLIHSEEATLTLTERYPHVRTDTK